jgi:hypothetical protein
LISINLSKIYLIKFLYGVIMLEDEVNLVCKKWLEANNYKYKGILNTRPNSKANVNGYGQVPIPDGYKQVLIDHCGINDKERNLIWIEAKGSDVGMSQLLEGFIRMAYACYHGGGKGLLAIPHEEFNQMKEQEGFLKAIAIASEKQLGLFDTEKDNIYYMNG